MTNYQPEVNEYGQIVAGLCEYCDQKIYYEADGDYVDDRWVDCGVWELSAPDVDFPDHCPESPNGSHAVLL